MDKKKFEIGVPDNGRIYHLFDGTLGSDVWVDALTDLLNAQRDYLRLSRRA